MPASVGLEWVWPGLRIAWGVLAEEGEGGPIDAHVWGGISSKQGGEATSE